MPNPSKNRLVYDHEFLQIVREKTDNSITWIVRHLSMDDPSIACNEERFDSLAQALQLLFELVDSEEKYATPVDLPHLSPAAKERLDGEHPKLYCIDPVKLEAAMRKQRIEQ